LATTEDRVFSLILGLSPSEAFASLLSHTVFDYRQKKPLKYSNLSYSNQFRECPALIE
jgi:hypothetical protein